MKKVLFELFVVGFVASLFSCSEKKDNQDFSFELLTSEKTGINFSNTLKSTKDFNIFNYMYFYNGGGVGAGDLNNDGLVDLIFTANQESNKIFLNRSGMKFEDITEKANF